MPQQAAARAIRDKLMLLRIGAHAMTISLGRLSSNGGL
jgi:hypothetical protein